MSDVSKLHPVSDPAYWSKRLDDAMRVSQQLHHSIFKCTLTHWLNIEERHRVLLKRYIGPADNILDVGCGYGRLLELLPRRWIGQYLGVDISHDFLDIAKENHPTRTFGRYDMRDLSNLPSPVGKDKWDVAVLISIRPMIIRHLGSDEWCKAEFEIRKHASKILFLECDPEDEGVLE